MEKQEISFCIKKALGMRKGWKIIADDGEMIDGAALKTVVSMIKDMECQVSKSISVCIISSFCSGLCCPRQNHCQSCLKKRKYCIQTYQE